MGIVVSLLLVSPTVQAEAPPTPEAIAKAWSERQKAVTRFHFEVEETMFMPAGGHSRSHAAGSAFLKMMQDSDPNFDPTKTVPAQDHHGKYRYRIDADGADSSVKYDVRIVHWMKAEIHCAQVSASFVDSEIRSIWEGHTDGSPAMAKIETERNFSTMIVLALNPVYYALRGESPYMLKLDPLNFKATGVSKEIHSRKAFQYKVLLAGIVEKEYWICPSLGMVPVRVISTAGGNRTQHDYEYRITDAGIVVPVKWKFTNHTPKDELLSSSEFKVTSYTINAKDKPDLKTVIPVGTMTYDGRPGGGFGPMQENGTIDRTWRPPGK